MIKKCYKMKIQIVFYTFLKSGFILVIFISLKG